MPKLGLTMEEGTILEWLVSDGDSIQPGMPVLRIETDKVESDVEATSAGRIHLSGETGQSYPCGAVIGYLLAEGEDPPQTSTPLSAATADVPVANQSVASAQVSPTNHHITTTAQTGRRFISPNAYRVAATLGVNLATVTGSGPGGRIVSEDVQEAAQRTTTTTALPSAHAASGGQENITATAAARQLADLLGVDLRQVPSSSGNARIERDDIALYVRQLLAGISRSPAPTSPASSASTSSNVPAGVKKMSGMRSTIAKRMHASLQEMAQLTLYMDADFDRVIEHRNDFGSSEAPPGFTDYLIAASGRALARHRYVNSQIVDGGIAELPEVNIGLAVAIPGGLVVPVIRQADQLPLADIARESKRLANAARDGRTQLEDLEGGTFSVTALGMFGVDGFTPVINPPNAAILGVGRLRDDIVIKKKGKISTVKRLTLSLTWDHRVFDGAPAAEFCRTIVDILNDPQSLG